MSNSTGEGKLEGEITFKGVEKAVVERMDKFWDRATMSSSAGVIWRTSKTPIAPMVGRGVCCASAHRRGADPWYSKTKSTNSFTLD